MVVEAPLKCVVDLSILPLIQTAVTAPNRDGLPRSSSAPQRRVVCSDDNETALRFALNDG
jgi:hypothetical protein